MLPQGRRRPTSGPPFDTSTKEATPHRRSQSQKQLSIGTRPFSATKKNPYNQQLAKTEQPRRRQVKKSTNTWVG